MIRIWEVSGSYLGPKTKIPTEIYVVFVITAGKYLYNSLQ